MSDASPSELEMHRMDFEAVQNAGFYSPGELLAAYRALEQQRDHYAFQLVETRNYWSELYAQKNDELESLRAQLKAAQERSSIRCANDTKEFKAAMQKTVEQFSSEHATNTAAPIPAQQSQANKLADTIKEQQEIAWIQICRLLDELSPDWMARGKTGIDCALEAIRDLSKQQSPAVSVHELKDIEVTDQMASAFNQAICDDAMNDQDLEEIKTGLRAAISHLHPMPKSFYELEIERLVALNNSLLANEIRLIERLRTMQQSPRITEQDAPQVERLVNALALVEHMFECNGLDKKMKNTFEVVEDAVLVGRALLDKLNNTDSVGG